MLEHGQEAVARALWAEVVDATHPVRRRPDKLHADKDYDVDHFVETAQEAGREVIIPPKRNCKTQHAYNVALYKERNRIERFFNNLKQFRCVTTRYGKCSSTSWASSSSLQSPYGSYS